MVLIFSIIAIIIFVFLIIFLITKNSLKFFNDYPKHIYKLVRGFQALQTNINFQKIEENSIQEFIFCSELAFYLFYHINLMLRSQKYKNVNEEKLLKEFVKAEKKLANDILSQAPSQLELNVDNITNVIRNRFELYCKCHNKSDDSISFELQTNMILNLYGYEIKAINNYNKNPFKIVRKEEELALSTTDLFFSQVLIPSLLRPLVEIASLVADDIAYKAGK